MRVGRNLYRFPVASATLVVLAGLILAGCAAGDERFTGSTPAGFWYGLWHGIISLVALVVGLFYEDVEVYERVNSGAWYDFGFLLGAGFMWGSGHHSHRRWKWSRNKCEDMPAGRVKVDISWKPDEEADEAQDKLEA